MISCYQVSITKINSRISEHFKTEIHFNEWPGMVYVYRLTSLFSFQALSREAPVYREQKSNIPSNTGLYERKQNN